MGSKEERKEGRKEGRKGEREIKLEEVSSRAQILIVLSEEHEAFEMSELV